MKQNLYLIRGAPGSGKSTFAKNIIGEAKSADGSFAHFEADMYHLDKNGVYKWEPNNLKKAHKWCFASAVHAIESKVKNVIVSNTFTKLWELSKYTDLATTYDLDLRVYHIMTKHDNIHNVPSDIVDRMLNQYEPLENEIEIKD